jgi:putative component of toxin-antitoxin plasmid stabilization module
MVMQIRKTDVYAEWIDNLRDLQGARADFGARGAFGVW